MRPPAVYDGSAIVRLKEAPSELTISSVVGIRGANGREAKGNPVPILLIQHGWAWGETLSRVCMPYAMKRLMLI